MSARIGVDLTYLYPGRARGHQRFCEGLAAGWSELRARGQLDFEPVLLTSREIEPLFRRFALEVAPTPISARSSTARVVSQNTRLASLCRTHSIDLLFCPGNSGPLRADVPIVITLHDLHHRRYAHRHSWLRRTFFRCLAEPSYRRAIRIAVPSRFTAEQARDILNLDCTVIPLSPHLTAGEPDGVRPRRDGDLAPGTFFLCVCAPMPHKNVDLLVRAFRGYRSRGGTRRLVLIGPHRIAPDDDAVTVLQEVDDDELRSLYASAAGLVSASEYEGFGLPMAEALAQGCPVLAPRRAAIPEVLGRDGLYIETLDEAHIAGSLFDLEAAGRPPTGSGPYGQRTWVDVAREYGELFIGSLRR